MSQRIVAIVGAGQAGLVSAKYALAAGLLPCIFEQASQVGGLWAGQDTAIWDGLYSNIPRFHMSFSDHQWPPSTGLFASKKEVFSYLASYSYKHALRDYIRFETKVVDARQRDQKWLITYKDLKTGEIEEKVFDSLMIATGMFAKPKVPTLPNRETYRGLILHSSEYRMNDPRLKDKRVLIVGGSLSAVDLAAHLVGYAKSVLNIFSRAYLVAPRIVAVKQDQGNSVKIVPIVSLFWNRESAYFSKRTDVTKEQKRERFKKFLRETFPTQTIREQLCDPSLFVDIESEEGIAVAISDTYIEKVISGQITPRKAKIKELTTTGVVLENLLTSEIKEEEVDVIVLCTGYGLPWDEFLDKRVVETVKRNNPINRRLNMLLYKHTFHPDVPNLAFISQIEGLYYLGAELQARLACMYFTGAIQFDRQDMLKELEEIQEKMKKTVYLGDMPYGNHVHQVDNLARAMNLLPDFDTLKQTNPDEYRHWWHNNITASQFSSDPDDFARTSKEIDFVIQQVYPCSETTQHPISYQEKVELMKQRMIFQNKY